MTWRAEILSRFSGQAGEHPSYLLDPTLWYDWQRSRGTLPDQWRGYSLPRIARALGVPTWLVVAVYRVEAHGAKIVTTEQGGERVVRIVTSVGTLTARWTRDPDGDWWQVEYPLKPANDLAAVLEAVHRFRNGITST
jgi:hypothetical protein